MPIIVKGLIMYISGVLSFTFGEFDIALRTLLGFMFIDYATGVIAGFYLKELNSKRGFKGIIKKSFLFMIVAMVSMGDEMMQAQGVARSTIIYFFISTEGLSILENSAKFGVPIPKWLMDKLEQIKDKNENNTK